MHPLVLESLAQQRLQLRRGGFSADIPRHLQDDLWIGWASNYTGPGPIRRALRSLFSRAVGSRQGSAVSERPSTTVAPLGSGAHLHGRPLQSYATNRPAIRPGMSAPAVIGCRV